MSNMKKLIVLSALYLMVSCGNKEQSKPTQTDTEEKELPANVAVTEKESKPEFKKYLRKGILLKELIQVFDKDLNVIETIDIKEITEVEILAKSIAMYNLAKSTDYCLKSNFIKINYKEKELIVFGSNIYEINEKEKFDFKSEKNEAFSVFSMTNFQMGASDDVGLTGCDDFSLLIILNHKDNKYKTLAIPDNQEYKSKTKFANLVHDDGSSEEIYNAKVVNDTLVMGIKIGYQEGYGSYFLKTALKDNFTKSEIADVKRFEEESTYNELK
ncbi:hypothetical protein SAMN06265346_11531 [Flavobacterium hercynium]|nr:hypothetical protein SAMN06265346_11531 [Flavobacterium hercynium]